MTTRPQRELESFPNPRPERDYEIAFDCPEFTCLCPKTGQPDFATIRITYVPAELCVELKSLKLYLWSFRDEGAFHEAVTNQILDDLVAATAPRWMRVEGDFLVRGGIHTVVSVEHGVRHDAQRPLVTRQTNGLQVGDLPPDSPSISSQRVAPLGDELA